MNASQYLKDLQALGQVLRQLNQFSSNLWRAEKDFRGSALIEDAKSNYESLITRRYPIKDADLEEIIEKSYQDGKITLGDRFYLPPLEGNKEFIALLFLDCDFKKDPPKVDLRVGMYRFTRESGVLQGFGFRFEMHDHSSNHNYYHVQITTQPHKKLAHEYVSWIPEELPCVLLPATNPVSLVFCILISFYGRRISERMISPMNIDRKYKEPLQFLSLT